MSLYAMQKFLFALNREHGGRVQERCGFRGGRELRGELPEHQVLGPRAHEVERGDVPERRGAAVAEDHLVALGQGEQLGQTRTDAPDEGLDRLLPVRRAEVGGAGLRQCTQLLGADLRRAAAEAAVGRLEVGGDGQLSVGHVASLSGRDKAGNAGGAVSDMWNR